MKVDCSACAMPVHDEDEVGKLNPHCSTCLAQIDFYDTITRRYLTTMGSLKEEALAYEPPQTLNIADLDEVPVEVEIAEKEGDNKDGEHFKYKVALLNGKEYRVPNSVLEEIQTILKLKPSVTKVKVHKTGSGLATRYKVDALD